MASIYDEGGRYGDRPPDIEESIYGPLEQRTLPEMVDEFPDAFNLDPEAAAAIERGEKTPLEIKEERATALGMSLRDYLTEEQVATDRAAWNEEMRAQGIDPPQTEKYGFGEYGKVDDLHAQGFKYGDKPPENWQAPDYSPEGRTKFQEIAMKQAGGNPFTFNVNNELEKATNTQMPQLFDDVFRGQVRYSDRHKMSNKQKSHWQTQLNRWRSYVESDLITQKDAMAFQYNNMMNEFDAKAEAFKASEAALNKKLGKEVEIFHPDKDYTKKVTAGELPKYESEGWIAGTKTGAKSDTPTVGDYQKVFNAIKDAFHEDRLTPEGNIQEPMRKVIDEMSESLGLPTLREMAGVGADEEDLKGGWYNAIRDWFQLTFPGMVIGAMSEPGAESEGADTEKSATSDKTAESAPTEPTALDESGAPYPDSTPGTFQGRPTVVQNGHWVFQ